MADEKKEWKYTEKQQEALTAIAATNAMHCLLYGGSGSGKTATICMVIIKRALKVKSRHAIGRRSKTECIKLIGKKTMPECFEALGMIEDVHWTYVNDVITILENGSEIHIIGVDTKDGQYKKVLGDEYSTLYFNEANDISYVAAEFGLSRMRQQNLLKKRFFYDCNPPSKAHWLYKKFFLLQDPDDESPLDAEDHVAHQINPDSNIQNLDPRYVQRLKNMSAARRKKFYEGEFGEVSVGKVFNSADINAHKVDEAPELDVIVVSVDPQVSSRKGSDDCGIVVGGKQYGKHDYYVLFDGTIEGAGPGVWPGRVANLFKAFGANYVLAETNQGGELVIMAIRNYNRSIPVQTVHAKVGKAARAEPVAELYAQGRVHHVREGLEKLETEMTEWDPEYSAESPNRVDAITQLITKLSEGSEFYCVSDEDVVRYEKAQEKQTSEIVTVQLREFTTADIFGDDSQLWN